MWLEMQLFGYWLTSADRFLVEIAATLMARYRFDKLKSGDVCIKGSNAYADYRDKLLPWAACAQQVAACCREIGCARAGSASQRKPGRRQIHHRNAGIRLLRLAGGSRC
jgi:hypothetical protein